MPLPDAIHITETANVVSLEDTTGRVLREIATVPADADTFARAPGAQHVIGAWVGDTLEVRHATPDGRVVVESWLLANDGRTLVATVSVEGDEQRPARSMKRVYVRTERP